MANTAHLYTLYVFSTISLMSTFISGGPFFPVHFWTEDFFPIIFFMMSFEQRKDRVYHRLHFYIGNCSDEDVQMKL